MARQASLQGSLPRHPQVLAGPSWPAPDYVGINGDFFMQVGTNNTFIMFGPKANNTWVGVAQCTVTNQLIPTVTYLQYLGDQAVNNVVALPSNGTGSNGQLCFLLDLNGTCCAVAINNNGVWNLLFDGFGGALGVIDSGGQPVYTPPAGQPFENSGPGATGGD